MVKLYIMSLIWLNCVQLCPEGRENPAQMVVLATLSMLLGYMSYFVNLWPFQPEPFNTYRREEGRRQWRCGRGRLCYQPLGGLLRRWSLWSLTQWWGPRPRGMLQVWCSVSSRSILTVALQTMKRLPSWPTSQSPMPLAVVSLWLCILSCLRLWPVPSALFAFCMAYILYVCSYLNKTVCMLFSFFIYS